MKLALLLGVSKYQSADNNLPACANDVAIMQRLLEASGQFAEIYVIDGSEKPAHEVKDLIVPWIEKYKGTELQEVFFYYTGHGQFHKDDFYFQLYDTNATKRKQSSLTNTELDTWLRTLGAELTVKVIDACQSGIAYIKDGNQTIEKYFSDTVGGFKKCIFMFSSTTQQSSFQDEDLSFFTRTFVEAVRSHPSDSIRYRDIMDYISDEFEVNTVLEGQTPVFVIQAHNTEVFCLLSSEAKGTLFAIESHDISLATTEASKRLTLVDVIARDAKGYANKETALKAVDVLAEAIEEYVYFDVIYPLFKIDISRLQFTGSLPLGEVIGQWLLDNQNQYFAEPTYRTEEKYAYGSIQYDMARASGRVEWVKIVDGFMVNLDAPFKAFTIIARREFPNIYSYYCSVTYLVSRSTLKLFYLYTNYRDVDWDQQRLNRDVKWQSIEVPLTDFEAVKRAVDDILLGFEQLIMAQLQSRFNFQDEK